MADLNDIHDTESEIQRQERENRETQLRRDQAESSNRAAQQERLQNGSRQRSEAQLVGSLRRLNKTGNRVSYLQIKRRLKTAQLKLSQLKNSALAKYDIGQIVLRLSPLLLYPAAFGMNCLFLAFISRYYARELVLDNALLKPHQATIILISIILLPLFLLWMDISLQSQWVAAQGKFAKGLWFTLAAIVCLIIPAIYIYTAWLNRDVNAGETEASVNNIMLLIKGAIGLIVNILVLLGGHLLHEGKSLLIFLLRISGMRLWLNWLHFRIRRAQTRLVDTFNEFNRALNAFNNPLPVAGAFQAAIDLPTRQALREQFGYEVVAEPNTGGTSSETGQAVNDQGRSNAHTEAPQDPRPTRAENNGNGASNANDRQEGPQTETVKQTQANAQDNAQDHRGIVFNGYGEEEVRP